MKTIDIKKEISQILEKFNMETEVRITKIIPTWCQYGNDAEKIIKVDLEFNDTTKYLR